MSGGAYDVCVYCQAPGCEDGSAVHLPDCPSVTGVYPVTRDDVEKGMVCTQCGSEFSLDPDEQDTYALLRTERSNIFEVVCLGCKVQLETRAV